MAGNEPPKGLYERKDVNEWAVAKFGIALVILCAFALLILAGLFKFFAGEGGKQPPSSAKLPPEPRLQQSPLLDLKAMREAEDQILNGYGWVDQKAGIVRVPINRAIDMLAQRGLPSRPQAGPMSASTASVPAESGLGYIMQRPGGPLAGEAGKK